MLLISPGPLLSNRCFYAVCAMLQLPLYTSFKVKPLGAVGRRAAPGKSATGSTYRALNGPKSASGGGRVTQCWSKKI